MLAHVALCWQMAIEVPNPTAVAHKFFLTQGCQEAKAWLQYVWQNFEIKLFWYIFHSRGLLPLWYKHHLQKSCIQWFAAAVDHVDSTKHDIIVKQNLGVHHSLVRATVGFSRFTPFSYAIRFFTCFFNLSRMNAIRVLYSPGWLYMFFQLTLVPFPL